MMVLFIWGYAIGISIPPLVGWGRFIPEGILDSCSFDYLSKDWNNLSFGIFLTVTSYILPLLTIIYSYVFIVKAIVAHESAMRAQAKKMNVSNLRSGGTEGESAEMRVAKAACINVTIWLFAGLHIVPSSFRACSAINPASHPWLQCCQLFWPKHVLATTQWFTPSPTPASEPLCRQRFPSAASMSLKATAIVVGTIRALRLKLKNKVDALIYFLIDRTSVRIYFLTSNFARKILRKNNFLSF